MGVSRRNQEGWHVCNMVWPILSFQSSYQFLIKYSYLHFISKILKFFESMLVWFDAKRFFRIDHFLSKAHIVWRTYGLTKSIAGSNQDSIPLEPYCPLKAFFFYFKVSQANASHRQYRLTHYIVCLVKFNQYLSKTDMVQFVLYLTKYSINSYQDTIPFEPSCALKDSQ